MKAAIGQKLTIVMPDGLRWPGVATSDEVASPVTIVNRSTSLPVDILVSRVDVISLRTTREGDEYLVASNETVQYGYRPIAEPRFSTVVGLDATPEGEIIDLQSLIDTTGERRSAWQAEQFAARQTATPVDLL